jgi:hypothetical protein
MKQYCNNYHILTFNVDKLFILMNLIHQQLQSTKENILIVRSFWITFFVWYWRTQWKNGFNCGQWLVVLEFKTKNVTKEKYKCSFSIGERSKRCDILMWKLLYDNLLGLLALQ